MCFFQAVSRATRSRAAGQAGGSSSPVSTSARERLSYPSTTDASQEAVPSVTPVVATDRVQTTGCSSGWQQCPFDSSDRSETALFSELQGSVSHAWAQGTHSTYRGPWNMFVRFCNERNPPLCPMPASAVSVACSFTSGCPELHRTQWSAHPLRRLITCMKLICSLAQLRATFQR